jgi:PAS domain S-box-containing protein
MTEGSAKQSSISTLLIASFVSVGVLMILGGVVALLELNVMRGRAEYLSEADHPARAVLRVRSDFLTYQRTLRDMAAGQNAEQFGSESRKLMSDFDADVTKASDSLKVLPAGPQRDSELNSLEAVRTLFAGQVESLTGLAQAGDWLGVDLRIQTRMPLINELSESVVRDIDAIVEIEKKSGLEATHRAQVRATWTLVAASLLALITAAVLGIKVTQNIAGRLERLDAAVHALARGEFTHELVLSGNDEISRLGVAFIEMSLRLRRTYGTLQRSEAHFRSLIENASEFILILDGEGIVRYASPSCERAFGGQGKTNGREIYEFIDEVSAEELRKNLATLEAAGGSRVSMELRTAQKTGAARLLQVFATNLLEDPSVKGIVLNARDITTVNLLEAQLRQSQRMEAVGTLSGGIAHDFNNLLTVIRGYTNQLLESEKTPTDELGQIRRIDEAAERAASLTNQLLAFSRRQVLQPKVFDVNALVANLEILLRRLISEDIEMQTVPAAGECLINADPGQIEQVIMNIVINARDAMPRGGKLMIETECLELDKNYAEKHAGAAEGPYVMLAVSDTGEGMDAETKARIFEPFFTTKGLGKGTGLGLSTVYGIVKQSGGYIWVYSEPGQGTTFKVYFPRVRENELPKDEQKVLVSETRGQETILVVEDEPAIRELVKMVLTGKGYSVLAVEEPRQAAAVAASHVGPIHLLFTDVVLPGTSGREVARQISAVRPKIKVLFTSGYTPNAIVHHGVLDEGLHFLQKPFTAPGLVSMVREVLDGNA